MSVQILKTLSKYALTDADVKDAFICNLLCTAGLLLLIWIMSVTIKATIFVFPAGLVSVILTRIVKGNFRDPMNKEMRNQIFRWTLPATTAHFAVILYFVFRTLMPPSNAYDPFYDLALCLTSLCVWLGAARLLWTARAVSDLGEVS